MKLPAALSYFGILFAVLAASGATAGETEDAKTLLEPLSSDDSFEQQAAARSLRSNLIWSAEGDDFRTALTSPPDGRSPPTAAPDDSETSGGGVVTEKDEVDTPGECYLTKKFGCDRRDEQFCKRHLIAKKYCKWCPTCNKCANKCTGLNKANCINEPYCKYVHEAPKAPTPGRS